MRRIRGSTPFFLAVLLAPSTLSAQDDATVAQARTAFDELDYSRAVELAEAALETRLSEADLIRAYEVLGYSYAILDQADLAVSTLSQMIVLDPDREPDRQSLPPRIAGLYDQAFDQVLVVRGILIDSIGFVSGEGRVTMHYEVSRPSTASLRLVGQGVDTVITSTVANPGPSRFDWGAMLGGAPVPPGEYQLVVTAEEGRNQYQRMARLSVAHAAVDTLAHQGSLEGEGIFKQPETEIPPRDWRPLGIATLLTGAAAGAALALNNSSFEGGRTQLGIGATLTLGTGLWLSLRQPEPRPVELAIEFNRLVDQMLADRNARIARDNEELRRRVRLTIVQVPQ